MKAVASSPSTCAAHAIDDVRLDHRLAQAFVTGCVAGEPNQPVGGDKGTVDRPLSGTRQREPVTALRAPPRRRSVVGDAQAVEARHDAVAGHLQNIAGDRDAGRGRAPPPAVAPAGCRGEAGFPSGRAAIRRHMPPRRPRSLHRSSVADRRLAVRESRAAPGADARLATSAQSRIAAPESRRRGPRRPRSPSSSGTTARWVSRRSTQLEAAIIAVHPWRSGPDDGEVLDGDAEALESRSRPGRPAEGW